MRICKLFQKIMHPIVRGIYFDFVPIYTGAKRLSRGTDLCDGKLLVNQTIPSGYLMEGTGRFDIYLPSGYVGSGKKYPVLYLLHGLGYNPGIWESRMNLTRLVDEFVRDGAIDCSRNALCAYVFLFGRIRLFRWQARTQV